MQAKIVPFMLFDSLMVIIFIIIIIICRFKNHNKQ